MNLYSTVFININLNEHFFFWGGRGYFSFSSDSISFIHIMVRGWNQSQKSLNPPLCTAIGAIHLKTVEDQDHKLIFKHLWVTDKQRRNSIIHHLRECQYIQSGSLRAHYPQKPNTKHNRMIDDWQPRFPVLHFLLPFWVLRHVSEHQTSSILKIPRSFHLGT